MNRMDTAPAFEFNLDESLKLLSATPGTLSAWLTHLPDRFTASSGDRDNWAPYDIIGHLIHCDETDWIPRARVILAQGDDRSFPPFDRYGQFERQGGETLSDLLIEFTAVRRSSLEEVVSWDLTEQHLGLTGIHPEFGEVPLRELLATWVVHDQTHIRQIAVTIARRYEAAVGPWKAYLGILN